MAKQGKKKILKVASVIPPHVTTASMVNLLKAYRYIAKKHQVEFTIFVDEGIQANFPGFRVKKVRGMDSKWFYKALFVLGLPRFYYPSLVKELEGFDVIETSTPEFYIYAYQSYLAAKKYGSRLVLRTSQTIHDFFLFPYTKWVALPFARKTCEFAKWLCFTNPESRDSYVKLGILKKDAKNVIILGHGVDTAIFRPIKVRKGGSKKVLLSVGALMQLKGHQNIIRALAFLNGKGHKNLELWIVGKGDYQKTLEDLASELGCTSQVKFLGAMGHEQLALTYNKSDIFVLGNIHDVTPAVSEAMLCNLPVVASRCGGIDFVIPSEKIGIITGYNDPKDLAVGIERILGDRQLRQKLAKNSRNFILKNFSIQKVAERLYRAYTR